MSSVVVGGAEHPAVGVPADGVVETLDEFEDRPGQLPPIGPVVPVEQLDLQGGEESFGDGVVQVEGSPTSTTTAYAPPALRRLQLANSIH